MQPERIRFRCPECGSDDLEKRVPHEWDNDSQDWQPNMIAAKFQCRACGSQKPAVELGVVRAGNLPVAARELELLDEVINFYLEHTDVSDIEQLTLDGIKLRLDDMTISDYEFSVRTGEVWQAPKGRFSDKNRPLLGPSHTAGRRNTG